MNINRRSGRAACLLGVVYLLSATGEAAILDFNATTSGQYITAPYDEDGFSLQVIGGHYDFFGPGALSCNLIYVPCTTNFLNVDDSSLGASTIRMTLDDGGDFDLFGLDLLESYQYNQQSSQFSACGSACVVRSSNGGQLSLNTAGAIAFSGPEWRSLAWVEFFSSSPGYPVSIASAAIDNVDAAPSVVPAPAAGWLFATGMAAVFGRRLRKTA